MGTRGGSETDDGRGRGNRTDRKRDQRGHRGPGSRPAGHRTQPPVDRHRRHTVSRLRRGPGTRGRGVRAPPGHPRLGRARRPRRGTAGGVGAGAGHPRTPAARASLAHRRHRRSRAAGSVPGRGPVECHRLRRQDVPPGALPLRRGDPGLPARPCRPSSVHAPDESAHRRRRRPRQDHRSRPGHAGAHAPPPRPDDADRLSRRAHPAVAGRDAGQVRPGLQDPEHGDAQGTAPVQGAPHQSLDALPAADRLGRLAEAGQVDAHAA